MSKLVVILALVLTAASCGSGSSADIDGASGASDGRPQSFEDIEFTSPLSELLGFGFSDNEDAEAEFAEIEQQAQQIIAECMIDKGFEYQPIVQNSSISFGPGGEDIPYFSDEWVDKYGFGISTQRFPQSSVGDLVGYPDERFDQPVEFEDPNREYLESLSDGEREAYQLAMNGEPPDFDAMEEDENFFFEPGGCQGEAFEQAYSRGPGGGMAFYQTFGDDLQAMEERARSDPRVIEYNNKVAECVADTGEVWVDQESLYERFEARLSELQPRGFGPGGGDPFEAAGVDPEEMSEREMNDFFRELERIDPADLPKLAALQEEEIALARTVVDCDGGPLNEAFFLRDIRIEYEQEFIDNNAEALAEFSDE